MTQYKENKFLFERLQFYKKNLYLKYNSDGTLRRKSLKLRFTPEGLGPGAPLRGGHRAARGQPGPGAPHLRGPVVKVLHVNNIARIGSALVRQARSRGLDWSLYDTGSKRIRVRESRYE